MSESSAMSNWIVLLPVVAGGLAVWALLPSTRPRPPLFGALAGLVALAGLGAFLLNGLGETRPESVEAVLFFGFSALAIVFGVLMITGRNPARSAISFAVAILSTTGLFLLLAAPFLMAATITVYAGAIVVMFLFVIMLAHQSGPSNANLRSRDPDLAVVAGFVILSALLVGLQKVHDWRDVDRAIAQVRELADAPEIDPAYLSPLPPMDQMGQQPVPLSPKAETLVNDLRDALERVRVGTPRSARDGRLTDHRLVQEIDNEISYGLTEIGFKQHDSAAIRASSREIADGLTKLKSLRDGSDTFDDVTRSPHGEVKAVGSGPKQLPAANVSALGRTIFSDHLLAIELVGTLLLVATAGTIAIAGRREKTRS